MFSEGGIKESSIKTVDGYGSYNEVFSLVLSGKIKEKHIPEEYKTNEMLLAIKIT